MVMCMNMFFFSIFSLIGILVLKIFNKYKSAWCKSNVCLLEKTVIVTGANSGIGYETALNFAQRGAKVILACRDDKRAGIAKNKIIEATRNDNVVVRLVDFGSLKSVRNFAREILENEVRLDVLVNNAGIADSPNLKTEDGLQMMMQVNYFGPVLLTLLLLDLLKKTNSSRIVNVSSLSAMWGRIDPENLNYWSRIFSYGNSKLGIMLFTIKLASVLNGSGVSVFSVSPGVVKTEITKNFPSFIRTLIKIFAEIFMKTAEEGAQTSLHASLALGIEHLSGRHFEECEVVPAYSTAKDPALVEAVWKKTVEILDHIVDFKKIS